MTSGQTCPKTKAYGKHSWRGERLADAWYWMVCQWCGRTVLHSLGGARNDGTECAQ